MKNALYYLKQPYHFALPFLGAFLYGFPSNQIMVIGVTGTKGKSSTTEMLAAIFEDAGYKTALLNSIRVKVGDDSKPNLKRMSMPGRFFIQGFLHHAVEADCRVAILEMTSQGAAQFRERGIAMDGLLFLNLAPEHIESHGSYEAYADAKFNLGKQLQRSHKHPRIMIANGDDPQSTRYLHLDVEQATPFSLAADSTHQSDEHGGHFTFEGTEIAMHLPGEFSLKNALAAATMARAFGITVQHIKSGLEKVTTIPGRAEKIEAGQKFTVVVDYAHTPDSLEALYKAYEHVPKICVLGSMGGGRDTWNRPEKAKLAGTYCTHTILTNEDPVDEDPQKIIDAMKKGLPASASEEVVLDRREAIAKALARAHSGDAVLITGKGTDPTMYLAHGKSIPWSDAQVVREELQKLQNRAS